MAERWAKAAATHFDEYRTARKGRPWLAPKLNWKLLTLTVKVSGDMAADWKRINECWREFRRLFMNELVGSHRHRLVERHGVSRGRAGSKAAAYRKWLKLWLGGFASREVGAGKNVHMHVMLLAPYLRQERISELWEAATGDSFYVDVRAIKGGLRGGAREVAKYITKMADKSPADCVEIYEATLGTAHGRPWGKLHGKVESAQVFKQAKSKACGNCGEFAWVPIEVFEGDNRNARGPP